MTKREFLVTLRKCLSGLPKEEIEQQLNYYSEMIDDGMEEGLSEQEAVSKIGDLEEIIDQLPQPEKKKHRLKTGEIILLAVGSPVWLSLLIAAAAVVFSVYVSWWSVVVSLWAVFASLTAGAVAGIVAGVGFMVSGFVPSGLWMISAAFVCAGLSIFLFYGCKYLTAGTVKLTKKALMWRKSKKEEA